MERTLHECLPVDDRAPSWARRRLKQWLASYGWPADNLDDLVIATNEAVANAVEHAYPGGPDRPAHAIDRTADEGDGADRADEADGATISLDACVEQADEGAHRVVITVRDGGRWQPPRCERGFRGRGLIMMRVLTESVAFSTSSAGTQVTMVGRPAQLRSEVPSLR